MRNKNSPLNRYIDVDEHLAAVKWAIKELSHRSYLDAIQAACKLSRGDIPIIDRMVARWLKLEYEAHSGCTGQGVKWMLVLTATKRAHSNIGSAFFKKKI